MRRLLFVPVLTLLVACSDGNPLQPKGELSLTPEQPELIVGAEQAEAKMVPFKARGTWWGTPGDATEAEITDCVAVGGTVDVGTGIMNVSHLGRSGYRFLNCWGEVGLVYQVGRITAANGDELYFFGPGELGWEVFEVDWVEGTYEIGFVWFTGGTGRFEGASGRFMTSGDAFYGDDGWYGTELWDGMISSVGSSK